jgi:hypothetical protein
MLAVKNAVVSVAGRRSAGSMFEDGEQPLKAVVGARAE